MDVRWIVDRDGFPQAIESIAFWQGKIFKDGISFLVRECRDRFCFGKNVGFFRLGYLLAAIDRDLIVWGAIDTVPKSTLENDWIGQATLDDLAKSSLL